MKLTLQEKQTLIGPLVIGSILGVFVAWATIAFAGEYASPGHPHSKWQTTIEAAVNFLISVFCTVCVLGVIPIAIHRLRARPEPDPEPENERDE